MQMAVGSAQNRSHMLNLATDFSILRIASHKLNMLMGLSMNMRRYYIGPCPPCSLFCQQYPNVIHIARTHAQFMATSTTLQSPSEHRVILDNQTLYVDQSLAEALGWKPEQGSDAGIELSLSGCQPTSQLHRPGVKVVSHSAWMSPSFSFCCHQDRLARGVVESSHNANVKRVLDYLEER
jgi:hypothetical protein